MNLSEFHEKNVAFVKKMYESNTEEDYDMMPFLASLMVLDGEEALVMHAIADGDPLEMAHKIIHNPGSLSNITPKEISTLSADEMSADNFLMITFAVPMWRKSPDEPDTRIGEGVMLISETPTKQIATVFDCRREPLPTLYEMKHDEKAQMTSRIPLLYNPNNTEH